MFPIVEFNEDEKTLLRWLADNVYEARLRSGAAIRDAGDFKAWLLELACETDNLTVAQIIPTDSVDLLHFQLHYEVARGAVMPKTT